MKTWKLTLEYDGTKYSGWQEQINARTVAGALRGAIEGYLEAEIELMGAGRTDAGVHALGQVAHVRTRRPVRQDARTLQRAWNERLPSDIAVLNVEDAAPRFHARHDATARTYLYQMAVRKTAFHKRHVWWIKNELDIPAMRACASLFTGRHNFSRFAQKDPSRPDESPVVVVNQAEIFQDDFLLLFRIDASHFLWRMVRRLVGVTVKAGLGEVRPEEVATLLTGAASKHDIAAWTAPAAGLFLESVRYD